MPRKAIVAFNRPCICGDPACSVEYGTCHCGCGKLTNPKWKNGRPRKFHYGHTRKITPVKTDDPPFLIDGEPCRLITLLGDISAIVDERNYDWLMQYKWSPLKGRHTTYAHRNYARPDGSRTNRSMHRDILGLTDGEIEADHKNGNGLDNRESNLRPATPMQQRRNTKLYASNRSGHRGVSFDEPTGKWRARIKLKHRELWLGRHLTYQQAVEARKKAEEMYFGDWARER
jgi:hypothetical protein